MSIDNVQLHKIEGKQYALAKDVQPYFIELANARKRIEALEKALRRLVSWGAACPTEREDRLSHAAEGAKAFHAARAALGEDVHD